MHRKSVFGIALFAVALAGCSAQESASDSAQVNSDRSRSVGSAGAPAAQQAPAPETKGEFAFGVEGPARRGAGGAKGYEGSQATGGDLVSFSPFDDRDVIRLATLEVRVKDIDEAEKAANAIISELGGYIDSVSSTDLASTSASLTLVTKVPVRKFESAIQKFEALGVRLAKTVQAEDVTKELVDREARIKTLTVEENLARDMLASTKNVNEIFTLREKLSSLRLEIEALAGQNKSRKEAADLSTVTVTLRQGALPAVASQDPNWFAQAYGEVSMNSFRFLKGATVVVLYLVMFSPIWGGALLAYYLVRRQIARKAVV